MPTVIDALVVTLGLDSTDYKKGHKAVQENLKKTREETSQYKKSVENDFKAVGESFSSATRYALTFFAVLAGAESIKSFVTRLTQADAALGRFAANIGMAPSTFSAWTNAIERQGGSAEAAAGSFRALNDAIQDLRLNGQTSPTITALTRLGAIGGTQIDVFHGSTTAILKQINRDLYNIRRTQGDAAAAFRGHEAGLDDSAINLLKQSPAIVDAELEKSRKLGVATVESARAAQQLVDSWTSLQQAAEDLGRQLETSLGPKIIAVLQSMSKWVEQNRAWLDQKIGEAFAAIGAAISSVANSAEFKTFVGAVSDRATWQPFLDFIRAAGNEENWKPLKNMLSWFAGQLQEIRDAIHQVRAFIEWADQNSFFRKLDEAAGFRKATPDSGPTDPLALANGPYADPRTIGGKILHSYRKHMPSWLGGYGDDDPRKTHPRPGRGRTNTNTTELMGHMQAQLIAEGVPPDHAQAAAAALVGNVIQESGGDPTKHHDGNTGYGIYGARLDRRDRMFAWLTANGYSRDSAEGQARYMAHEAMSDPHYSKTAAALRGATQENLAAVTDITAKNFESPAPASANYAGRMGNAIAAYNAAARHAASLVSAARQHPTISHPTTNNETHHNNIGPITIHTKATDANGIARDMREAMRRNAYVGSANTGLS